MMLRSFGLLIVAVALCNCSGSSSGSSHELSFRISNVFGSHMVIQSDQPISLFGWDEKGSKIKVEFNNKKYSTTADVETGLWRVELPPMKATFNSFDITVIGSSNQLQVLEDVLFGDVILCSGQNNMEFTLDDAVGGDIEA